LEADLMPSGGLSAQEALKPLAGATELVAPDLLARPIED
jgi:hypothetical protein